MQLTGLEKVLSDTRLWQTDRRTANVLICVWGRGVILSLLCDWLSVRRRYRASVGRSLLRAADTRHVCEAGSPRRSQHHHVAHPDRHPGLLRRLCLSHHHDAAQVARPSAALPQSVALWPRRCTLPGSTWVQFHAAATPIGRQLSWRHRLTGARKLNQLLLHLRAYERPA